MSFHVIDNPSFDKFKQHSGFSNSQFKKLAGLFSQGASNRALYDMGVDVDFDEGVCTCTYYRTSAYEPYLQFVVRQVGPRTTMYEVWKEGKGRIAKSGIFDRSFEKLESEITELLET